MPTEALVAGNKTYPNEVLAIEFENQYNSLIDLMDYVTVKHDLEGVPGMKRKIRRYTATDGTEVLAIGEGNSETIKVDYAEEDYEVILLQNRFAYNDEEAMTDPNIVDKGLEHQVVDMYNKSNALCMAEFGKTSNYVVSATGKFDFDAFVDLVAKFPAKAQEGSDDPSALGIFAFVHKDNVAELRKNLKDDLKQIEAFVRKGYIGTVNGVSLIVDAIATKDEIVAATKKAVVYDSKTGTQVETERDANCRYNEAYMRKYGLFYLEDENVCVKLLKTEPAA